jgi:drug/metabolite transporter (DMT)-like permease
MKKALLQLHLSVFLAGFTGVLGRLITVNESLLVWYRMFFSALILLAISMFTKKIKLLHWKKMLPLIGIGGIIALHWVTFYGSIKYANISIALVCFSAVGFFSSFLDPLISNRKPIMTEVLLGMLVMLGVYLIFHFDQHFRTGIIFGITSAFLATIFPILNKRFVGKHDADTITFYEIGGGWMVLNFVVPVYLMLSPVTTYLPNAKDLFWLLFMSLFCTVLAFNLSVRALSKVSPFTVNLTFNLEPVYGILLAFLFYNEHKTLGPSFYAGISIIILTVVLQTVKVWRDSGAQKNYY